MAMYLDRLARVPPPRSGGQATPAVPNGRAIACNAATTAVELDTDLAVMAWTPPAGGQTAPGGRGRVLVQCVADGGDVWVCFGTTNAVVANSAVVSAGNVTSVAVVPDYIPAGKAMYYELDPTLDKWLSARTANGGSNTMTLRYRVISQPTNDRP